MKSKKVTIVIRVIITVILIQMCCGYIIYNKLKKVTLSKYNLDGQATMYRQSNRLWGYEIDIKKINGSVNYDEININEGQTVNLKIRVKPKNGQIDAFLEDPEGKVIKEKEAGGTIGGFWEVNYKNIKGPYILKLKVHGNDVGANIKIKW